VVVHMIPAVIFFLIGLWVHDAAAAEKDAADFTLPDLKGEAFTLSSLRGEIVLLKLGTTWCASCTEQSREIEALAPYLAENEVHVVEVYLQDTLAAVKQLQGESPPPFSRMVVMDDGRVQRLYNVYAIPRLILIDRAQKIEHDGSLLRRDALKKLLESSL